MFKQVLTLFAPLTLAIVANAQTNTSFPLWPDGAPGALGKEAKDIPTLTIFLPEKTNTLTAAIVIYLGGGYGMPVPYEGKDYALWLSAHSIAGFVLKYRLVTSGYHHPARLQDAAREMRTVGARAGEWGVDPHCIGIMGSSAGGQRKDFIMEVVIQPNTVVAAELVARLIAKELCRNPRTVLGLAIGRTMDVVYERLTRMHKEEGLDFAACRTFNLDEYAGLSGSNRYSYRHHTNHHLFYKMGIDLGNTHLPDGVAQDPEAESDRYERLIAQADGIDLQLLGIGYSGHLGSNEPLSSFRSRTRVTALAPATIAQNASIFGGADNMPRHAITMGLATILDSRCCLLLATGRSKADIIAKAVEGPITSMVPATALQTHPNCIVVTDQAAGRKLKESSYYRWLFKSEQKWKTFTSTTI